MPSDNPIGQPFILLTEVQSTNNYAMARIQEHMAAHGEAYFAEYQTAGKGQRGKAWQMEPGQNIILSVVIKPESLFISDQFSLSAVIATACFDFFSAYAMDETKIKWPNDIYWKDRKAGGILIENVIKGDQWKYAVAGMGININQSSFPSTLRNPVSLKQITGKDFNTIELAKELCAYIDQRWKQLTAGTFTSILNDYNRALYKSGEKVTFKKNNVKFEATVKSVNENGSLVINDGQVISHGEVEWMLI